MANCPITTLRAAGLSQRKAEYVQDLATRFADGRLSAVKLIDMDDEQVMTALCEVRGIGRWTVEMFMIFTLRRPDVLPCGDLGVQKGLVRWLTQVNPSVHSRKLPETPSDKPQSQNSTLLPVSESKNDGQASSTPSAKDQSESQSDYFHSPSTPMSGEIDRKMTPHNSTRPTLGPKNEMVDLPMMTPRTEKVAQLPPFPDSQTLTRDSCKARLNKKIK